MSLGPYARFKDIPRLVTAPYATDVPWSELDHWIFENNETNPLNFDPDYQRGHVWTREQQERFVEFMLRGGESAKNVYLNHPGWMRDWKGPFEVVDGKQRLTAALAFLHGEIPAFGRFIHEYEDKLRFSSVQFRIHVNNLRDRKEVLKWYLEMNEGATAHTAEELNLVRGLIAGENAQPADRRRPTQP